MWKWKALYVYHLPVLVMVPAVRLDVGFETPK